MKIHYKQLIPAGIIGLILYALLIWLLHQLTGVGFISFFTLLIPTLLLIAVGHTLSKDAIESDGIVYNKVILYHLLKRILYFVFTAIALFVLLYMGYQMEGDSMGKGFFAFLLFLLFLGGFYVFLVIEGIVLFFKKKYRKVYCNMLLIGISVLYVTMLR